MMTASGRKRNLDTYERAREEVARHHGEYVVVRDGQIVAFCPTFDEAFRLADGDPDALVLQAGAEPVREPVRLGSRTWHAV